MDNKKVASPSLPILKNTLNDYDIRMVSMQNVFRYEYGSLTKSTNIEQKWYVYYNITVG